jgi:hypothetical protein
VRRRPGVYVCRRTRGAAIVVAAMLGVGAAAGPGPGSPVDAPIQNGIDAYLAGAPVHAMRMFVQVARARPRSALPIIWAGVAATAAGRIHDAEVYFHEGLRRPHSAFQARVTRGWLRRLAVLKETIRLDVFRRGGAPARPGTPGAIAALARTSNPHLTEAQASWIGDHVVAAARETGLDPWFLAAVVYIESRFDHKSISPAGAEGLGQLMPQTARAAGVDPGDQWGNLLGTALVLRTYYREFGDWSLALAAYNAGDGAVRRFGGIPPYAETRWYVNAVWAVYRRIHSTG